MLHRVSHLKHNPLKTHFTKLGSYKMEKIKKRREKGSPSPFAILESFTDGSLEKLVL